MTSLPRNISGTIQLLDGGVEGVGIFCKDISPKVNLIVRLESELAEVEAHHFWHYSTGTQLIKERNISNRYLMEIFETDKAWTYNLHLE